MATVKTLQAIRTVFELALEDNMELIREIQVQQAGLTSEQDRDFRKMVRDINRGLKNLNLRDSLKSLSSLNSVVEIIYKDLNWLLSRRANISASFSTGSLDFESHKLDISVSFKIQLEFDPFSEIWISPID